MTIDSSQMRDVLNMLVAELEMLLSQSTAAVKKIDAKTNADMIKALNTLREEIDAYKTNNTGSAIMEVQGIPSKSLNVQKLYDAMKYFYEKLVANTAPTELEVLKSKCNNMIEFMEQTRLVKRPKVVQYSVKTAPQVDPTDKAIRELYSKIHQERAQMNYLTKNDIHRLYLMDSTINGILIQKPKVPQKNVDYIYRVLQDALEDVRAHKGIIPKANKLALIKQLETWGSELKKFVSPDYNRNNMPKL